MNTVLLANKDRLNSLESMSSSVWDRLPRSIKRKIEILADQTGKTQEKVIEAGIDIYSRCCSNKSAGSKLEELVPCEKDREVFRRVMYTLAHHRAMKMSKDERRERARNASLARHNNTDKAQRSQEASELARKRWLKST